MLTAASSPQVCFLGPELGPLESLLVAPEGGDWYLEEANVSSSRTGHSDRCGASHETACCVCKADMGGCKSWSCTLHLAGFPMRR